MDLDISTILEALAQLWQMPGRVGPILAIAVGVVGLVSLARHQLTEWIPWLASRRGALLLVALFAGAGSVVVAVLEGETSAVTILLQAGAAALTAIGIRSGAKAAVTGGAATVTGYLDDGSEVEVQRHERVRQPRDYEEHPERYHPPRKL